MIKQIKKPANRTFYKFSSLDGVITHQGVTEINQVTVSGLDIMSENIDPISVYPELPSEGELFEGAVYSHKGNMIKVVKTHNRTNFEPEETPDLFDIVRPNTEGMDWVENEKLEIGDKRDYDGTTYQVIQSHTTQSDWTPNVVPALFKAFVDPSVTTEVAAWVQPTGAHDAYQIGDKVLYGGETWISKIIANVTVPNGDVPYNRYWEPFT